MNPRLVIVLGLVVGAALPRMAVATPAVVPIALEQALVRGDLARVATLCPAAKDLSDTPVLRALNGHACLALNRNNESFGGFASMSDPQSVSAWSEWTQGLVERQPAAPVAWYLRGDAVSRSGNWEGAVKTLSKAIELTKAPDGKIRALALNARGVALAYLGKHSQAKQDFDAAISADPTLADACLNCGTLLIIREAGDGAMLYLDQAVAKSPPFGLAHNARGCARLGGSRDAASLAQALADFMIAAGVPETKALAEANIAALKRHFTGDAGKENASSPGTTMTARDLFDVQAAKGTEAAAVLFAQQSKENQENLRQNFEWNKTWSGAGELLSLGLGIHGASLNIGPGSSSDRESWTKLNVMSNQQHFSEPGGGDTAKTRLENSSGDMGPWPVKTTRFGLHAGSALPTKP